VVRTAVFCIKNHVSGRERLVAVCDEEVLGRKLEQGKLRLHVVPDFYDGMRGDEEAVQNYLQGCTVANLVGKRAVDLAIRLGFVSKDHVLTIDGVPHAQWALLL